MVCPNYGKDNISTRRVTYEEEEFSFYGEYLYTAYMTGWTPYYEHRCRDCECTWTTG